MSKEMRCFLFNENFVHSVTLLLLLNAVILRLLIFIDMSHHSARQLV